MNITVTCRIENTYDDGTEIITTPTEDVPAPTEADWADDLGAWSDEHIFNLTGTGKEDGDAWYDVEITASSEPRLVGRTFEFGY